MCPINAACAEVQHDSLLLQLGKKRVGIRLVMSDDEPQEIFEDGLVYDWQGPCAEVLRERDPAKTPELLRRADEAIQSRLSRLEPWPDGREMTALNHAVQALRRVRSRMMI